MSLEKDLREAVSDLAFGDEAAAEVLYIFVRNMNDEEKVQSALSMILQPWQSACRIRRLARRRPRT